jgi:hypothetical protein
VSYCYYWLVLLAVVYIFLMDFETDLKKIIIILVVND